MVKPCLHLLTGKEIFLKKEFIRSLRAEGVSFKEFDAEEDSLSEFMDFAGSGSLFDSRKLAVLWSVEALSKDEQAKLKLGVQQHYWEKLKEVA